MRVEWTKDLETGIKNIDEEHRNLVSILNELDGISSRDVDKMKEVFNRLVDYTEYHFSNEEGLMNSTSYECTEDYADHCAFHKNFRERVLEFRDVSDRKGLSFSKSIQKFLLNWFVSHIKKTDQEMVNFVKKDLGK